MHKFAQLLTPLSFLRLRSPDLRSYQWYIPTFITTISIAAFYLLPVTPPLFTDTGLVNTVNSLLTTLVGFYIAALAAIATFDNPSLDQEMKGRAPKIKIFRQGEITEEVLSRRRFLVILFGYCAFISITLFSLGVASLLVAPSVAHANLFPCVRLVWLVVYCGLSSSLLVVTLLGLHYLIDRIHRE